MVISLYGIIQRCLNPFNFNIWPHAEQDFKLFEIAMYNKSHI